MRRRVLSVFLGGTFGRLQFFGYSERRRANCKKKKPGSIRQRSGRREETWRTERERKKKTCVIGIWIVRASSPFKLSAVGG